MHIMDYEPSLVLFTQKDGARKLFNHNFNVETLEDLIKLTTNNKQSVRKKISFQLNHPNNNRILSIQG
jgi:hypothetical protein